MYQYQQATSLQVWYHKNSRGNDEQDRQVGKISDPGTQGPVQRTFLERGPIL
jgi:hypothetical protein